MEWEEEVAKLPLPPLAHENSPRRLSWCEDLRCLSVIETPGLFFLRPLVSVLCCSISGGCASPYLSVLFTMELFTTE